MASLARCSGMISGTEHFFGAFMLVTSGLSEPLVIVGKRIIRVNEEHPNVGDASLGPSAR